MINCIAIDDEPLALEILETFCAKVPFLKLDKVFTDTTEAAKHLKKFPTELLFLDIQMPDMSGIDFYRQYAKDKMVIFTTAHSQYAVEGFNLNALDYLLKPIEFTRFLQAANKAQEYHNYLYRSNSNEHNFLFVRSEYSLIKIALADILFIETLDDYIKIHVKDKKPVLTKMNLKNVLSKLSEDFIRVHRSYVVPLSKVSSVRGKIIHLNGTEIPIGIKFEDDFFTRYGK